MPRKKKKNKFKVKIRWYKPSTLKITPKLSIEVLEKAKEVVLEEAGESPLDALINVMERLTTTEEGIFEAEVYDGLKQVMGEIKGNEEKRIMLYPRPARLLSVGIIRIKDIISQNKPKKKEAAETALFRIPADAIKMKRVDKEVYVYEGKIISRDNDIYLLILETDLGRRFIRVIDEPIIESLVKHVLTPPSQDQESHENEREEDEDNTPYE